MSLTAIIPAAGVGTRLRPHTHSRPKALLPVAGKLVLGHILDQLLEAGVDHVVLVLGYRGDMIAEWVAEAYPQLELDAVLQTQRLGLGHAVFRALQDAHGGKGLRSGRGLIVLGDTIVRADFNGLLAAEGHAMGVKAVEDPRPVWVNLSREVNPVAEVEADRTRLLPDRGRARGLEAIVTRDGAGALAWSLSYAWSRAEDRIDGRWAPRVLDQTHVLNARFAWDLRPGWQLSGSWQYHTGWPFTEQILDVVVAESEDGSQLVDVIERGFGPINEGRLPAYHRLDLRMTRAFRFERSTLEVFLDVFNVYDRINLRGYEWFLQEQGGVLRAARDSGEEQLPRLPTLGVRWVF